MQCGFASSCSRLQKFFCFLFCKSVSAFVLQVCFASSCSRIGIGALPTQWLHELGTRGWGLGKKPPPVANPPGPALRQAAREGAARRSKAPYRPLAGGGGRRAWGGSAKREARLLVRAAGAALVTGDAVGGAAKRGSGFAWRGSFLPPAQGQRNAKRGWPRGWRKSPERRPEISKKDANVTH